MIDCYLIIDFGSTYTKLNLIDKNNGEIILSSCAHTTIDTNIKNGFDEALNKMKSNKAFSVVNILDVFGCSSAGGGLKMVAIGVTPNFTVEAAVSSALGAGARLLNTYSYFLRDEDVIEINNLEPDIVLLSGGAENGNKKYIIHNAKKLLKLNPNIPIVVAGNSSSNSEIREIFQINKINFVITDNVMPDVNRIYPDGAREEIRKIFMNQIVYAKGIEDIERMTSRILMPTPTAAMKAAELLSSGTSKHKGIGDVLVVDIGGATTDVHSVSNPAKANSFLVEGLIPPNNKRTVEGDLGMRYSALSLYENLGEESFLKYYKDVDDIRTRCEYRKENPDYIPEDENQYEFDMMMAKSCAFASIRRHCGKIRSTYANGKNVIVQSGKDLRDIKYVIGTGGVIVNSKDPIEILKECIGYEPNLLLPKSPRFLVDNKYILSAVGVLSMIDSDLAFEILLNNLTETS
ncbi:methylaspartate mutase accessory protein GlmL [Gudongella sp. DL1XJH-153]|uniref:methylaspartate mutase accessory protein GlmL n=1 Tax=Gudongella sp. DL1XJH-153 TaxID=3409804 RepID=UPI003BB63746